jgi:hypothetical protein
MNWQPAITAQGLPIPRTKKPDPIPMRPELLDLEKKYTMLNVEERRTRMQYRPDALFLYNAGGRTERDPNADKIQLLAATKKRYSGELSGSAQKNLIRAFDNLMTASSRKITYNKYLRKNVPFQLGMITLTIPTDRKLSSKEMNKRLLKRFLQFIERHAAKRRKKLFYVWKCELQKRGQLHYHIILNYFIPWEVVQKFWVYLLTDTGLNADFYIKFGNHNPRAATKTESVKKDTPGQMRAYILKRYLRKKADQEVREAIVKGDISQIDGSVWGCSDALKEGYPTQEIDFATYMRLLEYSKKNVNDFVYFDFCMLIRTTEKKPPDHLISQKFKALIRCHRDLLIFGGSGELAKLN